MGYDENILACRKSYYNAARRFNSVKTAEVDGFDLLHDAICMFLAEEEVDMQTAINRVKSKQLSRCYIRGIDFVFNFKLKPWRNVAGWNKKACLYFEKVNRILKKNGYPIGQHAMNGGKKQFGRYSVDFYI